MAKGENLDVNAPTVTVTGSISGSFTVTGTDTPDDLKGDSSSVARVDTDRILKYDGAVPTIHGTATVTITVPGGTQVHYTLSGKRPTHKARLANTNTTISNRDRSATWKYVSAFTLTNNRPGPHSPTILKVRAYNLNGSTVCPNDKSKLLHIRFMIKPT